MTYLVLAAVVFILNVVPAFAPPTWSVLVLFRLNTDVAPVPMVLIGALAASMGRWTLAIYTRALSRHLPADRRQNLEAAGDVLLHRGARSAAGIALFALSPLPSAQLFEAAGLMNVRLFPFVAAFFAGRVVSYAIYVSGATLAKGTSVGTVIADSLRSPLGIALQVLLLLSLVALFKIDWTKWSHRSARTSSGSSP